MISHIFAIGNQYRKKTMRMKEVMDAVAEATRLERKKYHLTLGEFIEALEGVDPHKTVVFDIGKSPDEPHSYRGYYSDLAFETANSPKKAGEVLSMVRECLDATFTGYKGGEFVMDKDTPLWHAWGGELGLAVTDIQINSDGELELITKDVNGID